MKITRKITVAVARKVDKKRVIVEEERVVTVCLADDIAKTLLETNNEDLIVEYVKQEYLDSLKERKETRRHQSLQASEDAGFDFVDVSINIEEDYIKQESFEELISCLTEEQKKIVRLIYVEGYSQVEVAHIFKVTKGAINQRLKIILEKIKKILN